MKRLFAVLVCASLWACEESPPPAETGAADAARSADRGRGDLDGSPPTDAEGPLDAAADSTGDVPVADGARDGAIPPDVMLGDDQAELEARVGSTCAGCHVDGARQAGLDLEGGLAAATVGVASGQAEDSSWSSQGSPRPATST